MHTCVIRLSLSCLPTHVWRKKNKKKTSYTITKDHLGTWKFSIHIRKARPFVMNILKWIWNKTIQLNRFDRKDYPTFIIIENFCPKPWPSKWACVTELLYLKKEKYLRLALAKQVQLYDNYNWKTKSKQLKRSRLYKRFKSA